MTATVHRFRSRGEWLAARRIGSSDVAAILGQSPYRGPWSVLERLRGEQPDEPASADQERGNRLEPVVLHSYARAVGVEVRRTPPHTLYTREEWASATPDAERVDRVLVEAKTDRHRDRWGEPCTIDRWEPAAAEVVRADYYLQVAHQLWVLDAPAADLAVLLPGDDPFLPELRVYRIERDREIEAALVDRLRSWWQTHFVDGVELEPDGSDAAGRALGRRARSGSRAATLAEVQLAAAYETARRLANEWEIQRKTIGQHLVTSAGDAARLDLPVGRVSVTRSEGQTRLDERALLADHPELGEVLDQYRRRGSPYSYPRIDGVGGRT